MRKPRVDLTATNLGAGPVLPEDSRDAYPEDVFRISCGLFSISESARQLRQQRRRSKVGRAVIVSWVRSLLPFIRRNGGAV